MDKYKVLLVDDEEEAIEAIRLKLEWETLGFKVIGSAGSNTGRSYSAVKYTEEHGMP